MRGDAQCRVYIYIYTTNRRPLHVHFSIMKLLSRRLHPCQAQDLFHPVSNDMWEDKLMVLSH